MVCVSRQALNEAKKQNHGLLERVQGLQNEVADSDVRRAELEGQLRQSHTVRTASDNTSSGNISTSVEQHSIFSDDKNKLLLISREYIYYKVNTHKQNPMNTCLSVNI